MGERSPRVIDGFRAAVARGQGPAGISSVSAKTGRGGRGATLGSRPQSDDGVTASGRITAYAVAWGGSVVEREGR